jgi:hypothetical protein
VIRTNLGGEVVRGATEGPGGQGALFGEAKVGDFDVSVRVYEDVLGFEIAVDDVEAMQMVQGEGDLCGVEFGHWVWEALWEQGW